MFFFYKIKVQKNKSDKKKKTRCFMMLIVLIEFICLIGFSLIGFLSLNDKTHSLIGLIVLFLLWSISILDIATSFYSMRTYILSQEENKNKNINF